MSGRAQRAEALVNELRTATEPVPAKVLAERLGVTTRSVRDYVRSLNEEAGTELVSSSQLGYRLNHRAYARYRGARAEARATQDTPRQRLLVILRQLVAAGQADVFELGDQLCVSPPTIEADLGRIRAIVGEYDLILRRDRDTVHLEGPERQKRRLVRQVLLPSEGQLGDLMAAVRQLPGQDASDLPEQVTAALTAAGLEVNEFALSDLLVHLAIAIDRVRAGHSLPSQAYQGTGTDPDADPQITAAVGALVDGIRHGSGVELPPSERQILHALIVANSVRRPVDAPGVGADIASPRMLDAVRAAARAVNEHFVVELFDDASVLRLALHVQNLVARVQQGQSLTSPLGPTFKNAHPLVHEMSLYLAGQIEAQTGIEINDSEIDFLSFHIGAQLQQQLDSAGRVTLTLVAPKHGSMPVDLGRRLNDALGAQATVERLVTALDFDPATVTTDLVITVVDLPTRAELPTIRIGPFLTRADIDAVQAAVRAERDHATQQRLRSTLMGLLDPRLFRHVDSFASKEDAIEVGCALMAADGAVEVTFLADVLDRERRSSTAFGGRFAIPHSLYLDAIRTAICVLITDQPIPWGPSAVRLVVLFAVSPDGRAAFRDVLDELVRVLSEPANVESLIHAGKDFPSFTAALSGVLE